MNAEWCVAPSLRLVLRDDGDWVAFDEISLRSWALTPSTASFLAAWREGWRPGSALPAPVLFEIAPIDCDTEWWLPVVRMLASQALITDANAVSADSRALSIQTSWRDLRWRIVTVPPARGPAARRILTVARFIPLFVCVGSTALLLTGASASDVLARWRVYGTGHRLFAFVTVIGISLALRIVHEFGHAVVLGAATGRSTPVGFRLFNGFPQAFTDARWIATLPRRIDRVSVLLAGLSGELVVWTIVAFFVRFFPQASVPGWLLAYVVVVGPLAIVTNLLIPFYGTDGYFLLEEWARLRNLAKRARRAVGIELFGLGRCMESGGHPARPERFWLPWYGLVHVTLGPLLALCAATILGVVAGVPWIGAAVGLAAATWAVADQYRMLRVLCRTVELDRRDPHQAA